MRRILVLLLLAAAWIAFGGSARTWLASDPRTIGTPRVGVNVRPPTLQAWHNMRIDRTGEMGWPEDYWPYTLFPSSVASTSPADMATIRAGLPGCVILPNVNAHLINIYSFSNAYNNLYRASWDSLHFSLFDLTNTRQIRDQTFTDTPIWIVRQRSADSVISFNRRITMADSLLTDGIYLDDCTDSLQSHIVTYVAGLGVQFDCDGDGAPDDTTKMKNQYKTWIGYLVTGLRSAVGSKVLLANTRGSFTKNANLNGITIETPGAVGCATVNQTIAAMIESKNTARAAGRIFYGVVWANADSTNTPNCLSVVYAVPGVYYGVTSDDPQRPW